MKKKKKRKPKFKNARLRAMKIHTYIGWFKYLPGKCAGPSKNACEDPDTRCFYYCLTPWSPFAFK